MNESMNRRRFVAATAAAGVGLAIGGTTAAAEADKPALLGGKPIRSGPFPKWPIANAREEKALLATLRSGKWYRGGAQQVDKFEAAYARLMGAKHCVATSSGTTALVASLGVLGVGPGDEVIVTPYTFIASVTSIMMHFALPVFVNVDPETFLIDPKKIEAAITDRTAAIMPVHIGGSASDMDGILAVAKKHNLPVVEDACQAHLAQWRGRGVGSWGATGCFSFQVTKNLRSGEGGAVLTGDDGLAEKLYAFHNNCRARKVDSLHFAYAPTRAANFRMTEFQGALLNAQMTRLEEQAGTRDENARYLAGLLASCPAWSRPRSTTAARATPGTCSCSVTIPRSLPGCRGASFCRPWAPRGFRAAAAMRRFPGKRSSRSRSARAAAGGCFPSKCLPSGPSAVASLNMRRSAARRCGSRRACFWGPAATWTRSPPPCARSAPTRRSWPRHSS